MVQSAFFVRGWVRFSRRPAFEESKQERAGLCLLGELRGPGAADAGPDWESHLFTTVETYALLNALAEYPASFASGKLEARGMLARLHSMTYTLKILRANEVNLDGDFEARVEDLRSNWFCLDGEERRARLLCLWTDSLAVHMRIVGALRGKISSEIRYEGSAAGAVHDQAVFVQDWSPRLFMDCAAASAESGKRASVLPAEFLLVLCAYEGAGGPFAEYLSAHMLHNVDPAKLSVRADDVFGPRARLLGEAAGRLRAMSVPLVALPTYSDGGEKPGYAGFWRSALSFAVSGRMDEALLLAGRYDRMHEACLALAKEARDGASGQRADELRRAYDAQSKELADVRQSLTFRLLRKYDSTLGKALPLARLARRAAPPAPAGDIGFVAPQPAGKKDIVCMPVTEWGFRIQRTNHLMRCFARDGHRVFVLPHKPAPVENLYRVGELEKGVYSLDLDCRDFNIYSDTLSGRDLDRLEGAFSAAAAGLDLDPILFVSFPSWQPLADRLKEKLGCRVIFDVLDDFAQFSNVSRARVGEERKLAGSADLVLATSQILYDKCAARGKNAVLLPNAGDYDHFAGYRDPPARYARPVVGYFGAISDWFDTELVGYLAERRPQYSFVLIGHTFGADVSALEGLPNVHLLGEKPYADLPAYLHGFDACIIPFKDTELIRATHPVKVYEYMAAGKPVVARDMPELRPMSLCAVAASDEEFAAKLDEAVSEGDPAAASARAEFARRNTWEDRYARLAQEIGSAGLQRAPDGERPLVSFIVVSWNSAKYIEACLRSIAEQTYPNVETILVDNASSDETVRLAEGFPAVQIVRNESNAGFAEANNIGMRLAKGKYVALLNPDALASPGWTKTLVAELERDTSLAAASGKIWYLGDGGPDRRQVFCTWPKVGPFSAKASNFYGDEPRSLVDYLSGAAMLVRREVVDLVGPMDPGYFLYFDETDWCARMLRAGYGMLYVPGAEAWHKVSPSVGADQKKYYMERSRLRFALKNFDAPYMVPLFFAYAAESAGMLLRDMVRGDFGASRTRRRAVWWNLASLRDTLRCRAEDRQRMRDSGKLRSFNGSLPLRGVSP